MTGLADLYEVQKQDIHRAAVTLADAFQDDDIWKLFFKEGITLDQKGYMFEMPVRLCMLHGGVYATSDQFEGVMGWMPGKYADVTFWRVLRSGVLLSSAKAVQAMTPLAMKQGQIFAPLEKARRTYMAGRNYIYLQIVGVAPAHQGKRYGTWLLHALIDESEKHGLPIYLETQTEENVAWYEYLGFRTLRKEMLPVINLPHWEMVRETGK